MGADATLEILIQIRDELAGLTRTRQGIKDAKDDAEGFGKLMREGLGIGTGMQLAAEGINLLKDSMHDLVRGAFDMATEIKRGSDALGISGEAYQVVQVEMAKAGVEMSRFSLAVSSQTNSLALARNTTSAAAEAYKTLGLSVSALEQMSPDQRAIAVAHAVLGATDQTKAFQAAGQLLGSRGLPALLNGLRSLATDGFDKVRDAAKSAWQILGDDTAEKLHQAELNIERLKRAATIGTGQAIGSGMGFWENIQQSHPWLYALSALTNPFGTMAASTIAPPPGPKAPPLVQPKTEGPALLDKQQQAALDQNKQHQDELNNGLYTEYERRKLLEPVLTQQIQLYERLFDAQFGPQWETKRDELGHKLDAGTITDTELQTLTAMNDAEAKLRAAKNDRLKNVDTPLAQLAREVYDTTGLITDTLQGSVATAVSSLSNSIWGAFSRTSNWSDAFRNLGNIAGQVLSELMLKLLILKPLLSFFGVDPNGGAYTDFRGLSVVGSGGAPPGNLGTLQVAGAFAGGGDFVTSGPSSIIVGDNPGGVELVSVRPLSGIGQSTVNGMVAKMGGGGTALIGGGSTAGKSAPVTVNITQNNALGLAAAIRAELVGMTPTLKKLAVDAVQEAQMRNKLRLI